MMSIVVKAASWILTAGKSLLISPGTSTDETMGILSPFDVAFFSDRHVLLNRSIIQSIILTLLTLLLEY